MTSSFQAMKNSRVSDIEKLTKKLQEFNTKQGSNDERFWQITTDAAGNGTATIRFLPQLENEDFPFVRVFSHAFEGSNGWYIENCPTTLGKECPICEHNSKLWKGSGEGSAERKIVSKQKRKLGYISNIYVIKDPKNSENDGKVFLFKYGKKIFDMLNDVMNPPEDGDDEPYNPFDLWVGADFSLRAAKVDGYRNYDKSKFKAQAPLLKDEDEMEVIWRKGYSLLEFIDPKVFKPYNDLATRFQKVMGAPTKPVTQETEDASEKAEYTPPADEGADTSVLDRIRQGAQTVAASDDDEDMAFLKALADKE